MMDPAIAQRISAAAQRIERTKTLMNQAKTLAEHMELDRQLTEAENELNLCNLALRNEAGPG